MNLSPIKTSNNEIKSLNYGTQCIYRPISFSGKKDSFEIVPKMIGIDNVSLQKAISFETKREIYPFLKTAEETGNELFIFGGFVRELLMGKQYNDIDFAVSGDMNAFFKNFINNNSNSKLEYTTRGFNHPDMQNFQKIKLQLDGKKFDLCPLSIWQNGDSMTDEVLYRRAKTCDFTISSMFIKASLGKNGDMDFKFIDLLDGYKDMQNRVLKFANNEDKLFEENPERIVQAFRLKKKYHLKYDKKVQEDIAKYINKPTFEKDDMYYFRLRRGLKGLFKDNNFSMLTTLKDIVQNKLYRLF